MKSLSAIIHKFRNDKYIQNSSIFLVERVVSLALSLFTTYFSARLMPQTQFGELGYFMALIGTTIPLSKWAYDAVLVREIAQTPILSSQIIKDGLRLRFGGAIFATFIAIFTHIYVKQEISDTLLWVLALSSIFFGTALNVPESYFQAQKNAWVSSGIKVGVAAVIFILRIYILFNNFNFALFLSTYILDPFLTASLYWIFYKARRSREDTKEVQLPTSNVQRHLSLLKSSIPLALMAFVSLLNARGDFLIISQLLGSDYVAIYSTAAKLSEVWYFLPTVVALAYFPHISILQKNKENISQQNILLIQKLSGRGFYVAMGIALIMQFVAEPLIVYIYNVCYISAAAILKVHIWAGVFIFLGHPISKLIIAQHLERYLLYTKLIATTVNLALNYLLIPRIGIIGAAWASLVSYAIGSWLGYGLFKPTRKHFMLELKSILTWKS